MFRQMTNKIQELTQASGLRQIIDIRSHLLCFDHKAGQRECSPFCKSRMTSECNRTMQGADKRQLPVSVNTKCVSFARLYAKYVEITNLDLTPFKFCQLVSILCYKHVLSSISISAKLNK